MIDFTYNPIIPADYKSQRERTSLRSLSLLGYLFLYKRVLPDSNVRGLRSASVGASEGPLDLQLLRSTPVRAGQRFPEPLAPLSFNKRVRVWACKIRKPHTHVFVPTSHKAFLRNYWNTKELAANICHSPTIRFFRSITRKTFHF